MATFLFTLLQISNICCILYIFDAKVATNTLPSEAVEGLLGLLRVALVVMVCLYRHDGGLVRLHDFCLDRPVG